MMPLPGNAPSREDTRIMNGDVQGPEVRSTGNRNSTGHAVRAGNALRATDTVRVGCVARAANAVRAGSTLRVTDIARVGCTVYMRPRNQECGRPSRDKARARGTVKKIGLESCPVAVRMHPATAMSR